MAKATIEKNASINRNQIILLDPRNNDPIPITLGNNNVTSRWGGTDMLHEILVGRTVCVLSGAFAGSIVDMFTRAGMRYVPDPKEADVVVFSGGVDVDPALYGEKASRFTQYPSKSRDMQEAAVFAYCRENNVPMIGICRGAQFLHVMNGGKLWQNVYGHGGSSHDIHDYEYNLIVNSTSIHHQMLKPHEGLEIVAGCTEQITKSYEDGDDLYADLTSGAQYLEIEAGKYEKTKCWFVQGHPEVGDNIFQGWFMAKVADFINKVGYSNKKGA